MAGLVVVPILMGGVATILAKRYLREVTRFVSSLPAKSLAFCKSTVSSRPSPGRMLRSIRITSWAVEENAVQKVEAQGIRTTIDFSSFKREAWDVEEDHDQSCGSCVGILAK